MTKMMQIIQVIMLQTKNHNLVHNCLSLVNINIHKMAVVSVLSVGSVLLILFDSVRF